MANYFPPVTRENLQTYLLFAWCSPLATLMWVVGFMGLLGFLPPLSPTASAEDIKAFYLSRPILIPAGVALTALGGAVIGPFVIAISEQMKRIEGAHSPLAKANMGLGILLCVEFIDPVFIFAAASFRSDRSAELVLMFNDFGWLLFMGVYQTAFVQMLVIGYCILRYGSQTIFPRWLGFFNIWMAIGLLPVAFIVFFKSGAFAWNGVLAFYEVLACFCAWTLVMFVEVRKAILRQAADTGVRLVG